jgi:P-aminobenzoate N-oxygenase AurF
MEAINIADSVMTSPRVDTQRLFSRLIDNSHRKYIDLESFLPWDSGVDKSLPPKAMDQLWIHGTEWTEQLDEAQKLETAWLETARDASMFIHLEHVIPTVYAGYVNDYRESLDPLVYEYLMIFAREELTHIMAFHRYLKTSELPWYPRPGSYAELSVQLPRMRPEIGILFTLLIEWTAELAVMHGTQGDMVDPLTRSLFREHHQEEVRHIAFGKRIGEEYFERAPEAEATQARAHLGKLMHGLHRVYNYNPDIARYTSFHFPIQPGDEAAINAVQTSEANLALNAIRFREINDWCKALKII